jgi:predicted ferric reductase
MGYLTAAPPRLRRPPAARGSGGRWLLVLVLWAGLGVSLTLWCLDTPTGSINNRAELLIQSGRVVGLVAGYLLLVQILLRSRFGLLDRWIGTELLTRWHRDFGAVLLLAVLTHSALILVGYSILDKASLFGELTILMDEYKDMTSAVVAAAILVGIALLAIRAIRTLFPYELWKLLHLSSYVVLLLACGHQFANGQQLFRPGFARAYWAGLYLAVLACLVWGRLIAPLWLNLRHGFRVADVVDEGPKAISIYLSGRHLNRAGRAGAVLPVAVPDRSTVDSGASVLALRGDPRALAAADREDGGPTHDRAADLRPGVRVWAQGPMGSFTAVQRTRGRALLIAGGIGIAPIRALLEELPLGASVIYRASTPHDVLLRNELDRIAEDRHADVWYVIGARDDPARRAMLTGSGMQQIVPDMARRDVYLCGPGGFAAAARTALRSAGVPRRQLHDTMFEF